MKCDFECVLACPVCHQVLKKSTLGFFCNSCCVDFEKNDNGVYSFLRNKNQVTHPIGEKDTFSHQIKMFLKRYPFLFQMASYFFGALPVGRSVKYYLPSTRDDLLILNLGSGTKKIRSDVINLDFYPFSGVDIVADMYALPFRNESVDMIIYENVLEHLRFPSKALVEVFRIFKSGGKLFVEAPLLFPYHSSPGDYFRWTSEGLRCALEDAGFSDIHVGVRYGASSSLFLILVEWFAVLCSFGSRKMYYFFVLLFTVLFSPIRFFDYILVHYCSSINSAAGFYAIAKK